MIELFRTLFAPPRDLILVVAALWIGLALAEKRTEHRGVSKEALSNLTFYSMLGFIIGGRVLYAIANFSPFAKSPFNLFPTNCVNSSKTQPNFTAFNPRKSFRN